MCARADSLVSSSAFDFFKVFLKKNGRSMFIAKGSVFAEKKSGKPVFLLIGFYWPLV